jgi:hypothetical protein
MKMNKVKMLLWQIYKMRIRIIGFEDLEYDPQILKYEPYLKKKLSHKILIQGSLVFGRQGNRRKKQYQKKS